MAKSWEVPTNDDLALTPKPWDPMIDPKFYGAEHDVRLEDQGSIVVFAGTVCILCTGFLCTRIHNPNVDPYKSEVNWTMHKYRFRAGKEFASLSQSKGQLFGHLQRIFDHSNMVSQSFVVQDCLFLCQELSLSGWDRNLFRGALRRSLQCSPRLESIVTLVESLLPVPSRTE